MTLKQKIEELETELAVLRKEVLSFDNLKRMITSECKNTTVAGAYALHAGIAMAIRRAIAK